MQIAPLTLIPVPPGTGPEPGIPLVVGPYAPLSPRPVQAPLRQEGIARRRRSRPGKPAPAQPERPSPDGTSEAEAATVPGPHLDVYA
ncbi:MAG: hypothetical protein D6721_04315 [Gammaproteobacteria bacterium]|nr:MAG: hypothetical protein D6721_04315 [Gammaproteobacteria bacterium]